MTSPASGQGARPKAERPPVSGGSGQDVEAHPSVNFSENPVARFAVSVQHYRDMTNASVTSWGRSAQHNAAVGGVAHSLHLVDLAVDVTYDERPTLEEARRLGDACGLRILREGTHDHLEPLHQGG